MNEIASPKIFDCLIVGAGPVGLSLALGLTRQGLRVVVVEKESTTAKYSRAPAIWPATQEVLNRLGMAEKFLQTGIAMPRVEIHDADGDAVLLSLPFEELKGQTDFSQLLILPQSNTEQLLLQALESEEEATVLFATKLCDLHDGGDEVTARCEAGSEELTLRARVAVGCDGGHSRVRELLAVDFDGQTFPFRAALADVRFSQDDWHSPRLTDNPRLAIGIRITENTWRLILPFTDQDDCALPERTDDAVASLFASPNELIWSSEFKLHDRVASSFAKGRIVLAGDAAHLNSPVGGQGMNAGIQDTEPLVSAIVQAVAENDPAPLQHYSMERQEGVSAGVNRFTTLLTRILFLRRGRYIKHVFRTVNFLMRFAMFRRRVLRNLAMLESKELE